jgi:hypothetical protein
MPGPGLYANIHAKRKRGGKMRKKGDKGAPTADNFKRAAQTARKGMKKGGFPDLSGDGKTTMKDVLIGRGVLKKEGGSKMQKKKEMKRGGMAKKKRVKAMGGGAMKKRMKRGGRAMKRGGGMMKPKMMGGGIMKKRMKRGGKAK